jgi:DNA-binding NtrC family response regulator
MPGLSGLDVLALIRRRDPDASIVLLSAYSDVSSAVQAMRDGAQNFLPKPVDFDHLEAALGRAAERSYLGRRQRLVESSATQDYWPFIGECVRIREVRRRVEILAGLKSPVMLLGETGTGKGVIARLLHRLSLRADRPFVEVNCAGLSPAFLESELFGHERGAFTDARAEKRGLFEVADGGTLFLDEVGDLGLDLQPKLLKALEDQRFRRIGATDERTVDVRIIAATNTNLDEAVQAGRFRADLYYRLNVQPLTLPPLRERGPEEIALLAGAFVRDLQAELGRGPARLTPDAVSRLAAYDWPGNVRQLRNVLEQALPFAIGAEALGVEHLPAFDELRTPVREHAATGELELTLEAAERRQIARVLALSGGNRSAASRLLGITRTTLYKRIREFGLEGIEGPDPD